MKHSSEAVVQVQIQTKFWGFYCWNAILLCDLDDGEGQNESRVLLITLQLQMRRIKQRWQEHRSVFIFISVWALVQPLFPVCAGLNLISKIQNGKVFLKSGSLLKYIQLEKLF